MLKKLCSFNSRNKANGNKTIIEYEFKGGKYYWINSKGDKSGEFSYLNDLKNEIIECGYNKWEGFTWLV